MKVYVNPTDPSEETWSKGRIRSEWYRAKPELATESPHEADIIWLLSPDSWQTLDTELLRSKTVLCTINRIVPKKFTEQAKLDFESRDQLVNAYHVPNKYTRSIVSQYTDKPIQQLGNWFDSSLWQPMEKSAARTSVNIDENKYVIGSFQRDTEEDDLSSPRLEKGPDLFCNYVEKINQKNLSRTDAEGNPDPLETLVLLGGSRRQYVMNRLDATGVPYLYIEMASLEKLREMYACCDLYVVASRIEGGPQGILEAGSMKIPVISTRMGSAEFLLHPNCVIHFDRENVVLPSQREVDICHSKIQDYELNTHINRFEDMMRGIL